MILQLHAFYRGIDDFLTDASAAKIVECRKQVFSFQSFLQFNLAVVKHLGDAVVTIKAAMIFCRLRCC
ncbi:hypothetical protein [Klebsiella aerogenes]|uniref:hypothetical protein n=1 Tax=Klebsiella aerogenes TaxID=548 RepID=UPI0013FDEA70|nr:hypothetical protein [Klebsiella aerogenes]